MKLIKIISKSKDGNRMEVTAENRGILRTLHIRRHEDNKWYFFMRFDETEKPIFKIFEPLQEAK